jgi:hypothetical protein
MKINQIINETTTAGSVATVSKALGEVQSRPEVAGLKPVQQLGGKKKGPYANSLTEGAMKQLSMDLKELKDEEFKKKYKKTKQEARKALTAKPEPVKEAKLDEEDKIIAPGKGHKLKPGLLSKPENSMNPTDVVKVDIPLLIRLLEFAREDAQGDLDLHDLAEKLVARGARGKTLSMKDYEYVVDESSFGAGVIAGGPQYEGAKVDRMVKHITKSEKKLGHTKKEAENIAWATANKRGMLDNKNKKAK